jgi:hypothetical protein
MYFDANCYRVDALSTEEKPAILKKILKKSSDSLSVPKPFLRPVAYSATRREDTHSAMNAPNEYPQAIGI